MEGPLSGPIPNSARGADEYLVEAAMVIPNWYSILCAVAADGGCEGAALGRDFQVAAEGVGELHLARCSTIGLEYAA